MFGISGGSGGGFVTRELAVRIHSDAATFQSGMAGAIAKMRSFKRMAGIMGTAVAGLSALMVGKGVSSLIRFEDEMTQSLAIMGDVGESMREDMAQTAREVATSTRISAEQAAESYFFLASAGLDAQQSIQALPQVAQFAQAGMFDMATATDLATDAQSALGLKAQGATQNLRNLTHVTDVLVKANTIANASVEQFSTALTTQAGASLKAFNKDMEEGVAVLAAMADQGVKAQRAGSGLSRIIRLLTKSAVENAEAHEELGFSVFDASGRMRNFADIVADLERITASMSDEQKAATLDMLGFQARVQQVILPLLGTSEAIRQYEKDLREASGTTKEVAANQLKSLGARLDLLGSQVEEMTMNMAEGMVPGLEAVVGIVSDAVQGFNAMNEATGGLLGTVTTITGILGGLALVLGSLFGPVGLIVGGIAVLGTLGLAFQKRAKDAKRFSSALRSMGTDAETAEEAMKALTESQRESLRFDLMKQLNSTRSALRKAREEYERVSAETERWNEATGALTPEQQRLKQRIQTLTEEIAQYRKELGLLAQTDPTPAKGAHGVQRLNMSAKRLAENTGLANAELSNTALRLQDITKIGATELRWNPETGQWEEIWKRAQQIDDQVGYIQTSIEGLNQSLAQGAFYLTDRILGAFRAIAVEGQNAGDIFKGLIVDLGMMVTRAIVLKQVMQALNIPAGFAAGGPGVGLINLLRLVGLQHGGFIRRPTLAMLGEGLEPEIVAPASDFRDFTATLARQVQQTVDRQPGGGLQSVRRELSSGFAYLGQKLDESRVEIHGEFLPDEFIEWFIRAREERDAQVR